MYCGTGICAIAAVALFRERPIGMPPSPLLRLKSPPSYLVLLYVIELNRIGM
jgi:hypothetical protein